jgi:hypothetical protein
MFPRARLSDHRADAGQHHRVLRPAAAYGLSVSPNPLRRNPAYDPIVNPDRALQLNQIQYIATDIWSAQRSPFFDALLRRYVARYHGVLVYQQSAQVRATPGNGCRLRSSSRSTRSAMKRFAHLRSSSPAPRSRGGARCGPIGFAAAPLALAAPAGRPASRSSTWSS